MSVYDFSTKDISFKLNILYLIARCLEKESQFEIDLEVVKKFQYDIY